MALVNASETTSSDAKVWRLVSTRHRAPPAASPSLQLHHAGMGRVHKRTGIAAKIHGLCASVSVRMGIWVPLASPCDGLARGPCPQLRCLHRHCPGGLGRSNTGTYIKSGKIGAVNKLRGSGSANGKEMGQPGPEEGPAAFSEGRVCLGFYLSLNCPLEKFTTTLSGLRKRHNQGNRPLTRSQYSHAGCRVPASRAVLGSTKPAAPSCVFKGSTPNTGGSPGTRTPVASSAGKTGQGEGGRRGPSEQVTRQLPAHQPLLPPPALRYPALLTQTQPLLQMQKLHSWLKKKNPDSTCKF